jgi:hypothetical protein
MNTFKRVLTVGALAMLFVAGSYADTIELKDGRVLQGKYLGGTQVIVRFEIQGDVQTFRAGEVVRITFDRHSHYDRRDDAGVPPPGPGDQAGPPDGQPAPPPTNGPNDAAAAAPPDQGPGPDGLPPQDQGRPADNPPQEQSGSVDYPPPPRDARDQAQNPDRDRDQDVDRDRDRETRHGYVYAAPGTPVTVPAGQPVLIRMIDPVNSRRNQVGDVFRASLEADLAVNNILVARRGSDVFVRLAYAKEAHGLSGSSELQLELTRIMIDGREFPVVSGEYSVKGRGRGGDTARKVGGGAVVGAIIGGVAGGGAGAAIGAGVGGAAGAGAEVLSRGHEVRVPSETLLEFRLDQPVTVTPTQR